MYMCCSLLLFSFYTFYFFFFFSEMNFFYCFVAILFERYQEIRIFSNIYLRRFAGNDYLPYTYN